MNRKVYTVSAVLIALSIALVIARIIYGGQSIRPEFNQECWRVSLIMELTGNAERAKVRVTLPQDTDRQTIYNEHYENAETNFYIRMRKSDFTENRVGFWRTELLDGDKTIKYTFSTQLRELVYGIPTNLTLSKNPAGMYPADIQPWLNPSSEIQSGDEELRNRLSKIIGKDKSIHSVVRKIYDFVRGEVKYQSEKGSKDAKLALAKLVADCGGQARLFTAFCRAAGIPSRCVGGLILKPDVKKITHLWCECYIGGKWIPFDTVNGHYGSIPANYLEIYRGDYALIKHTGLSRFNYYFVIRHENIPPVDQPGSLYVIPLHFQSLVQVLILIPLGALVVAFMRVVVGIPTFGTFAPILLALAFREVSLWVGLTCVISLVFLGWILRSVLDYFKILIIPRLSIMVTLVVIFVLAIMIIGFHLSHRKMLYVSLFPIIIITWMIERFAVLQIEDGTPSALIAALGTAVVAILAYYLMEVELIKIYLFAFPELFLAIIAALLMLGRYTGIRLLEFWRFKEFLTLSRKKPQ
ncbi:MAG: 7TM domain-containing protein [Candidatus Omnitrophica bacterium]|nr:7TM domain-containing protein [Candidatus Omnitrophota bacterium]MDD5670072.1 7TM domain-containing protein [Candidatus Omnitrophota bacterium]